jgi:hypothetical protein
MKLIIRTSALTLRAVAAIADNSLTNAPTVAFNIHSSVPGGRCPMPVCNSLNTNCSTIRQILQMETPDSTKVLPGGLPNWLSGFWETRYPRHTLKDGPEPPHELVSRAHDYR